MRKITTFLLIALFVNLVNAQVQHADIIKKGKKNPTIAIEAFNGSDAARQKLEREFAVSGWFQVLPAGEAAKADFKVQAAGNENQFALNLQGNGKSISAQKQAADSDQAARQIVENAGVEASVVVNKVREGKGDFGYNARTGEYVNMYEAGVIDPTKVARVALENAASVAGMLLTTECGIVDIPEPAPAAPAMPAGGMM